MNARRPLRSHHPAHSARTNPPRPFVLINLAVTADGKIATANREISTFGSRYDLKQLFQLRDRADAVLCGATTVNTENADLGPGPRDPGRRTHGHARWPLRIVASGRGRVDTASRLFQRKYGPIVILTTDRIPATRLRRLKSLVHSIRVFGHEEIDFVAALRWLRAKWNVRTLLCEGGSQLNAALFRADLVDELHLTVCPWIIGGQESPTIAEGSFGAELADATKWRLQEFRRVGNELFLAYRRVRSRKERPSKQRVP